MADQAITTPFTESISPSELSQPHTAFQLRRTRNCKVPSRPGTKKSSSHRDTVSHIQLGSSIELEASGPHRSTSIVSLQSTMPSSTTSVNSGILSPKYTKTGRVSKAQKGVRGAHSCGCGKVSLINLLRTPRFLMHRLAILHCFCNVPLQPSLRLVLQNSSTFLSITLSQPPLSISRPNR